MYQQLIPWSLAQIPWQWHDGGHMSMHWGWWLLWVGVFFVLVWLAFISANQRTEGSSGGGSAPRESVEEALRRRFAHGEIDEDEFERRMSIIKESRDRS